MKLTPQQLSLSLEEIIKTSRIQIHCLPDSKAVFEHMARSIADEIKINNLNGIPTRLILPVGPVDQYPLLMDICNREMISWKNVFTFNMDEYCDWQGRPLPAEHPLRFETYMRTQVFAQLNPDLRIPDHQVFFPDPLHLDAISQQITTLGGIDTCYGGIGYHGHIAFNEPPNSLYFRVTIEEFKASQTRIVQLNPDTIVMNSTWNTGGNPYLLPPMAVTLGMSDILASRRIRLYCNGGSWQRTALRVALLSPEDSDYPVTLLQNHPDYTIIADEDSAQPIIPSLF